MMKKYDNYKDVSWYEYIKTIPNTWEILPNIALFNERIERKRNNEELLSVTITNGVVKQSEIDKNDTSNSDKTKYKYVQKGDIVYNKMRMWQGAIGVSNFDGIVSPAYVVLAPKLDLCSKFFHYQFRNSYYTNYSKRFSYGLCDDQLNLRYTDFKRMYSIVPPKEVQKK